MINQEHFSELIKELLMEQLPEFCPTIEYNKDGSFDCDLRNPSNEFSIWIATYNSEITLGIEAPDGNTGCSLASDHYSWNSLSRVPLISLLGLLSPLGFYSPSTIATLVYLYPEHLLLPPRGACDDKQCAVLIPGSFQLL